MNALTIRGLQKVYADGTQALKGIDLDVKEGDFFALLGPNGAGKSTAIGIVTGLVNKTAGEVSVFGHDIDVDETAAKQCIGIVPQEFNFSIFEKPFDIVINQAGYYGISRKLATERAEKYLKQLGLWHKRNVVSRSLSGGMKRRLMIARALMHEPKLLILDEPTAGVDIEIRREMWHFMREVNKQGITIILTTHYLEEAESLCRNIAIINHGLIIENTTMKDLLIRLDQEVFVLDVSQALPEKLDLTYPYEKMDETTLEVKIHKKQGINLLFQELERQGVQVLSMRNKANRLEELFMQLVQGDNS